MSKLFQWLRPSLALGIAVIGILVLGWGASLPSLAGSAPLDGSAKTVEPSAVYPGDLITFTIVVSNGSASDVSATVIDPSPSGVSYLSGAGSGTLLIGTSYFTWTGIITAHQSVTLNVYAQVQTSAPGGTITNTAVISDGTDTLPKTATFRVRSRVYLPLIMRRWPPIPYPTVLDAISNPNYTGNYNITWQAAELATSYILQEDDNSSFSTPQEYAVGAALNKTFTDKPGGRYYYRVRGHNEWGYGEWSNVQSTLVGYFFDDFSNPASGWRIASHPLYTLRYINNEYSIYVPLDFRSGDGNVDTWFDQPAVLAPLQPPSGSSYCVSVDTYFASEPGWWEQHSLIFGASADLRTLYRLETNVNGDWAVSKYTNYNRYPYGGIDAGDVTIIEWHEEEGEHVRKDQGRNHLKVIVVGTTATFYINGTALDYATGLGDLPYLSRVGVIGGSYEVTPVDSRFDNFMWSTDITMCP